MAGTDVDNPTTVTVTGTVTANAGTGPFPVSDNGGSLTVDASTLPLPTGASTEATLAGVKTGTDRIPALGQAVMASSTPVVVASNQSAIDVDVNGYSVISATTGNINSGGQTVSVSLGGSSFCWISITGSFSLATLIFEVSDDAGANYYQATAMSSTGGFATQNTGATGLWGIACAGLTNVRVRSTGISGTASIRLTPIVSPPPFSLIGGMEFSCASSGIYVSPRSGTTWSVAQSGTWNIGTVTTVSTVSAVSSITPGTGSTNLGKAEDTGHATGHTGVFVLAVRNDTPSALAGTNADYIPFTTDSESRLHTALAGNLWSDTFTATGNGTTRDVSGVGRKYFSLQITGTGAAATTWDVRLEGSNDNVNFTQILQHTDVTGNGVVLFSADSTPRPCAYLRARCAGLTLGAATNIIARVFATQ